MKNWAFLMMLVLCLTACKDLEVQDMFSPEASLTEIEQKADFSIRLNREEAQRVSQVGNAFRQKAAQECFSRTARDILELQPLLRGSYPNEAGKEPVFLEFRGAADPREAPLTGDLVQDFQCSLELYPYYNLAGEVAGLEEERTIAARGSRVDVKLFRDYPEETPAYFVVGRRASEQGMNLIKIFGSGRIIQIVGETSQAEEDEEHNPVMAQAIIMETNHEVFKGDLIFLTRMNVWTVDTVKEVKSVPASSFEDEVWVKPEVRKSDSKDADPSEKEMK
ncbi:MAG: hypothetical protein ACLFTF_06300 [Desulfonatronovibrio sp.]